MKPKAWAREPTLLLVDDKPGNLLALEAVLGEDNYILLKAHSGREAIEILRKNQDVALILLDAQMPGMDGFETATRIKRMAACKDIPIVFVTAIYTEDPFVKKGFEAGAIDYFGKPFDPEILRLKVRIYSAFRHKAQLLREKERRVGESEELLRTGRKLSAAFEGLAVGVAIADVGGRIVQTDEEGLRILNLVAQTGADSHGDFFQWCESGGKSFGRQDSPLMRALSKGTATHGETLTVKCRDGSTRTLIASASPLRGMDRNIAGAVVVLRDVTEQKLIEQDLEGGIRRLAMAGVGSEGETTGGRPGAALG